MGGLRWIAKNWVIVLNAVGVVGGLFFTAFSLRSETKTRQIANLLTITTSHREIWKLPSENPKLERVLNPHADLNKKPVTQAEQEFVNMVILHASSVHYAIKNGQVINLEGMRKDVCEFFALPIPMAVWEKSKTLQNDDFVEFVEQCRSDR